MTNLQKNLAISHHVDTCDDIRQFSLELLPAQQQNAAIRRENAGLLKLGCFRVILTRV